MNFSNFKIRTRLALGFGSILLLLTMVAAIGVNNVSESDATLHRIVDLNLTKLTLAEQMSDAINLVTRVMRTVALLKDEAAQAKEREKIPAAREKYDTALAALEKLPAAEKGKELIARLKEEAIVGRKANNDFLELINSDHDRAVGILMNASIPAMAKWQDTLREYSDLQRSKNETEEKSAFSASSFASTFILLFSGGAILLGVVVGLLITNSIRKQLGGEPNEAMAVASRIADGDLTAEVHLQKNDERSMMHAIKRMRDNLVHIVTDVRSGTDTIATASSQIAAGNMDLSSRTEEQAASLEETASSLEELTSTVKQNADNSRQANQLAVSASDVAIKGGVVVAQVVDTMSAINDSAKKIVDIISVIDGIAFQTNILALNAAVEAARAGEQGRGFAVVATEVRNLAQRSASAAKEIKSLINDSVEKVDAGSKLVNEAGATMEEVVSSVKRVSDIISEISAASQEQTVGIEQINQAISQMDQVTQQNAALVEEAAAAAGSMQDQASNLVKTVNVFKLESAAPSGGSKIATRSPQPRAKVTVLATAKSTKRPIAPKVTAPVKRIANAPVGGDWEEF